MSKNVRILLGIAGIGVGALVLYLDATSKLLLKLPAFGAAFIVATFWVIGTLVILGIRFRDRTGL